MYCKTLRKLFVGLWGRVFCGFARYAMCIFVKSTFDNFCLNGAIIWKNLFSAPNRAQVGSMTSGANFPLAFWNLFCLRMAHQGSILRPPQNRTWVQNRTFEARSALPSERRLALYSPLISHFQPFWTKKKNEKSMQIGNSKVMVLAQKSARGRFTVTLIC